MSDERPTPRWIYSQPGHTMWAGPLGAPEEQGILFFHPWDWEGFPPMSDKNWKALFEAHDHNQAPPCHTSANCQKKPRPSS